MLQILKCRTFGNDLRVKIKVLYHLNSTSGANYKIAFHHRPSNGAHDFQCL